MNLSRVREEVGLEGNVEEGRPTEKEGPVKKSRIIQTEGKTSVLSRQDKVSR